MPPRSPAPVAGSALPEADRPSDPLAPLAVALFLLSGVAGLGYQVAWTRMLAVGLGHEMPSLVAVVAAFLAGLALGGLLLDGPVSRSRRPGRWFAGCELVVAAWAVAVAFAAPGLNDLAHRLLGADPAPVHQWAVAFGLPFVALLPATVAMGATLPAMERLVARLSGRGTSVGLLYAVNTLGAAVGVLVTAFVVLPALGLRTTAIALAAIDVVCAVLVLRWPASGEQAREDAAHAMEDPPGRGRLAFLLAATGLFGIGFEIVGVRVLGQVLESTVYTFACTLAVWLAGTAAGAALWHRLVAHGPRATSFASPAAWMLLLNAAGMLLGALAMPAGRAIFDGVRTTLAPATGPGAAAIAGELAVAVVVFGPATLAMGATFSHLALAARRREGGIGRAAGVNTLAGAGAPLVLGVLAYPVLGPAWTLAGIVAAEALLVVIALGRDPKRLAGPLGAATALVLLVAAFSGTRDLALVRPPAGMRIIETRPGLLGTVAVAEDDRGGRILKVDDRFSMGGTARSFADRRQGHLPLLLHPEPKRALFLGVGAGLTSGAATLHGVEVTAVELVGEVLEVQERFAPANRTDEIDRLLVADARRFVRAESVAGAPGYDVIVADLFHPARDGAGSLYTVEHFEAILARLNEGGIFCQWLPLYQLGPRETATIVRTFLSVFDPATAWIAHFNPRTPVLGLVGARGRVAYPGEDVITRAAARGPRLLPELVTLALSRPIDVLGTLVLEKDDLGRLADGGPLNVDDRPRVTYEAPWHTYATGESGADAIARLAAAAGGLEARPGVVEDPEPTAELDVRAAAYRLARDRYLASRVAADAGDAAAAWRGLCDAARTSRDFTLAVTLGASEIQALAGAGRREEARARLEALAAARPEDPRLRELRVRLR